MFKRPNISKWLGALFAPIEKNGAFFVFMFVLGYLCTQLEIMPYYLRGICTAMSVLNQLSPQQC